MDEKLTKEEKKEIRKQEWQEKLNKEQRKGLYNKIFLWGGVALIVIVGIWVIANPGIPSKSTVKAPAISSKDITTGNKDAKVTMIEYADFQCPACGAYHPILKQLLKEFGNKIYFAYRYFPLTQTHKNAMVSAQAAHAAYLQGKFWEMHDLLFENQGKWSELDDPKPVFTDFAKSLNLDLDKFRKDMNDPNTAKFINDEENEGVNIGVNSTPTFFINNIEIDNPTSYAAFKTLLQTEIDKAK